MLEEMDAEELMEWAEWERLTGPLGAIREDLRHALLCRHIANLLRGKTDRPHKYEKFLPFKNPWFGKAQGTRKATTAEEMFELFKGLARATGGVIDDGQEDRQPGGVRECEHSGPEEGAEGSGTGC